MSDCTGSTCIASDRMQIVCEKCGRVLADVSKEKLEEENKKLHRFINDLFESSVGDVDSSWVVTAIANFRRED